MCRAGEQGYHAWRNSGKGAIPMVAGRKLRDGSNLLTEQGGNLNATERERQLNNNALEEEASYFTLE